MDFFENTNEEGPSEENPLPFEDPLSPREIAKVTILFYSSLFFISLYMIHQREGSFPTFYFLGKTPVWQQVLAGLGTGGLIILGWIVAGRFSSFTREVEKIFQQTLGKLGWREIFILAFFSAIGEEFFFRGALQPSWGLFYASLFFGLAHWNPLGGALAYYPLITIFIGFLLGALFIISGGGLIAPTIAHFSINFVNLYRINRGNYVS